MALWILVVGYLAVALAVGGYAAGSTGDTLFGFVAGGLWPLWALVFWAPTSS